MNENLSQWIADEALDRLHPVVIKDPVDIRRLLDRLKSERTVLERGTNRKALSETAVLAAINGTELTLRTTEFRKDNRSQVFLRFHLGGRPYFFSVPQLRWSENDELVVAAPAVIYVAERRDRARNVSQGGAARIAFARSPERQTEAMLADLSADGLSLQIPETENVRRGDRMHVQVPEGWRTPGRLSAEVRYVEKADEGAGQGWKKIGLRIVPQSEEKRLPIEVREEILSPDAPLVPASEESKQPPAERLRFQNEEGEHIACLVDRWGDPRRATAVVIPPAWGLTKETLMPLAKTLVETFRAAEAPIVVVRFDGIRKRGESSNDPECEVPGHENLNYTFGQGVSDILSTVTHLEANAATRPARTLLVSFSMASIEARKAIASSPADRFAGWVSIVGSSDPQSLMRVISGGIDYLGGAERGVEFGKQDVQGLLLDIDRASRDAIDNQIAFVSDAREDLASMQSPITWIHGRYDAWNDIERIRDVLSFGDTRDRRLIEIPTGHQLKTSIEALQTFGLVAREALRIATGIEASPVAPHPETLREGLRGEKGRLKRKEIDLRSFWQDYLLGRDGHLGIELVTQTQSFRELMQTQIERLALSPGHRLVDLGSGAGSAPLAILEQPEHRDGRIEVVEVDYVVPALKRSRDHIHKVAPSAARGFAYIAADLAMALSDRSIPLASESADCVLASLLLNYLGNPAALLADAHRVLRPGGRLVVSSLRPDADVSKICVSGVAELRSGLGREVFGAIGERKMNDSLRDFINDAGRLLDLEERGYFHFWEPEVLREMAEHAGFADIELTPGYGKPPQAWVLSARRL